MRGGRKAVGLREARNAAGLTQEFVAGEIQPPKTVKTLGRWEQRGYIPNRSHPDWYLPQLSRLYGIPVEDFMTQNGAS